MRSYSATNSPTSTAHTSKKLHTHYFLDSAPLIRPLPGARELLEAIAERGWRSALATSPAKRSWRRCEPHWTPKT